MHLFPPTCLSDDIPACYSFSLLVDSLGEGYICIWTVIRSGTTIYKHMVKMAAVMGGSQRLGFHFQQPKDEPRGSWAKYFRFQCLSEGEHYNFLSYQHYNF